MSGRGRGFGLEVGSKAELLMVMSMLAGGPPGTTLVCNGYKARWGLGDLRRQLQSMVACCCCCND